MRSVIRLHKIGKSALPVRAALVEQGFTDLNQAHLNAFHPSPDRMRASDLAKRAYMTNQAMNYLLRQLKARDFIERRAEWEGEARLV